MFKLSAGFILGIACSAGALAQTPAPPETAPARSAPPATDGGEIVVTARLREENLQDVPISLAAFGEQAIERQRIDSVERLSFAVPSLAASDPFGRNNISIAMRGIGLAGVGDELPVGIFIDGVYLAGRTSANILLTDLERIEVARGPQSALYGRNSFAGAINYVTRKPGDRSEGFVEVTAGSRDRYQGRASLAGPLIPGQLAASVGLVHRDWGGFYRNQNPAGGPLGRQETTAGNLVLRATPVPQLEALLRASFAVDRDSNPPAFLVPANIDPTLINGGSLGFFAGIAPSRPPSPAICCVAGRTRGFQRDAIRLALTVHWDLAPDIRLTSITAGADERQLYDQDADYTPQILFTLGNRIARRDMSQELRAQYDDGRFRLLGGAFAYRFENDFRNFVAAQFFLPPAARVPDPPRSFSPFRSDQATGAIALFSSASVALGAFNLTGDLRWNRETKDFRYFTGAAGVLTLDERRIWESWTPRLTLDWKPVVGWGDAMLYASAAKGFKTGGFNDQPNIFPAERAYGPETNWTYELGTKLGFDRRLFVNLTGFWIDWTDQQIVTTSAAGAANNAYIANAAATTSKGFELDLTARPVGGLDLNAAVSLADARFDRYLDTALAGLDLATGQIRTVGGLPLAFTPAGLAAADVSGNRVPRTSTWQAALGAEYVHRVALLDAERAFARADAQYRSRQCAEASNLACVGDQTRLNLRVGLEGPRYQFTLWMDNALDDRSPPVVIRFTDFTSFFAPPVGRLNRAFQVTPADGRTAGATLRLRWGG